MDIVSDESIWATLLAHNVNSQLLQLAEKSDHIFRYQLLTDTESKWLASALRGDELDGAWQKRTIEAHRDDLMMKIEEKGFKLRTRRRQTMHRISLGLVAKNRV